MMWSGDSGHRAEAVQEGEEERRPAAWVQRLNESRGCFFHPPHSRRKLILCALKAARRKRRVLGVGAEDMSKTTIKSQQAGLAIGERGNRKARIKAKHSGSRGDRSWLRILERRKSSPRGETDAWHCGAGNFGCAVDFGRGRT